MQNNVTHFHFLHPLWLLALLPFALLIWQLWQQKSGKGSAWSKLIDPALLPFLMVKGEQGKTSKLKVGLFSLFSLLAILALADPVWQRLPQPVYQQPDAQVIVMDLSATMLAQDVKPSRLKQERYKIEDILRKSRGKQTGLVVYAGDAFTVTPLTDDIATLKSQLRVLEPSLMPLQGIRPDLGLKQAGKLLEQAGYREGQVILLADEAGNLVQTSDVVKALVKKGYQVSVLGVGSKLGAPIPGIKDQQGKPILTKLDTAGLQKLAELGNGKYSQISTGQQDINSILANAKSSHQKLNKKSAGKQAQRWVEKGPWLAVLLLPIALFAFRKGWVLGLAFVLVGQLATPQPAMAFSWDDLWQRPDQQAAQALKSGNYAEAAALAPDAEQRGAAEYRKGNYQKAAQDFMQQGGAKDTYNQANALAKSGQYKKAIEAYDKALKQQPDMQNAKFNRKLVEDLLKKQQKKKQSNKNQKKQGQDKQSKNEDQKKQGQGKQSKNEDQKKQGQGKQTENKDQKKQGQGKQSENKDQKKQGQGKQSENKDQKKQGQGKQSENKDQKKQGKGKQPENKNQKKQAGKEKKADKAKQNQPDKKVQQDNTNQFSKAGSKEQQKKAQDAVAKAAKEVADKQAKKSAQAVSQAAMQKPKDKLTPEQRQSVENWLRRVPDDPGGLLRRKFLYQYQQRQQLRQLQQR